jgi:hypothetical protein
MVCLHMPCLAHSPEEVAVADALTGKRPGECCRATNLGAQSVRSSESSDGCEMVLRKTEMTAEQAGAIVEGLGLRARWRIGQLALTPRVLLGLEAAWASQAELLLFATVGLDSSGRTAVFKAVQSHLDQGSAIHLGYAYICQGKLGRDCPEGARCIDLQPVSPKISAMPALD